MISVIIKIVIYLESKEEQKMNKGVLLTIIVLVVLLIYLVQVEGSRNAQKEDILAICKEYISMIDQCSIKTEKEVDEAKSKLKDVMINQEVAINLQMQQLKKVAKQANKGEQKISFVNREVKKVKSYEFDKEQVKVTLECKMTKESINLEGNKTSQTSYPDYEITLKKEENRWKVVCSDLQEQELLNQASTNMKMVEGGIEF